MAHYIKNNTQVDKIWRGQLIAPGTYFKVPCIDLESWRMHKGLYESLISGCAIYATSNDGLTDREPGQAVADEFCEDI